jgi:hypothetical protein
MEQLGYLAHKGIMREWIRSQLLPAYADVLAQMPRGLPSDAIPFPLTQPQLELIGSTYKAAVHVPSFPALLPSVHGPVLGPALQGESAQRLQQLYESSEPKLVVVDNVLSAEALDRLQRLCLESTIWNEVKPWGYLGAYLAHGLHSPLLLQVHAIL